MGCSKVYRHRIYGLALPFIVWIVAAEAVSQERGITLTVRHDHLIGACNGTLIMDERGVRYDTNRGEDARAWTYEDIKEFQIGPDRRLKLLTYEDHSNWRFGTDKTFEFMWSEETVVGEQVYEFLRSRTRRPIASVLVPAELGAVSFDLPAKHLGILKGNQGRLLFADHLVVFRTDRESGRRTWRYGDLESISSSGPFDLTLTTYEEQRFHYASRRVYNFQLKEPLPRHVYDSLWRFVNEKKEPRATLQ
jgi:hypothetical protein